MKNENENYDHDDNDKNIEKMKMGNMMRIANMIQYDGPDRIYEQYDDYALKQMAIMKIRK